MREEDERPRTHTVNKKDVCNLITYYTLVLVYEYDLTNKIRMHVAKDYIVGFVFVHSFQLYNFITYINILLVKFKGKVWHGI